MRQTRVLVVEDETIVALDVRAVRGTGLPSPHPGKTSNPDSPHSKNSVASKGGKSRSDDAGIRLNNEGGRGTSRRPWLPCDSARRIGA